MIDSHARCLHSKINRELELTLLFLLVAGILLIVMFGKGK